MLCSRKKKLEADLRQIEQEYEKVVKDTEQLLSAIWYLHYTKKMGLVDE